jgi:hypothetical protein
MDADPYAYSVSNTTDDELSRLRAEVERLKKELANYAVYAEEEREKQRGYYLKELADNAALKAQLAAKDAMLQEAVEAMRWCVVQYDIRRDRHSDSPRHLKVLDFLASLTKGTMRTGDMRLWMVVPTMMCRQHLLGEHLECHMFAGSIRRGIDLSGYYEHGLFEIHSLKKRHDALVVEMCRRGYTHKTPLDFETQEVRGHIDRLNATAELVTRCTRCRENSNESSLGSPSTKPR